MPTTVPTNALTTRTKVKSYMGISVTDFDTVIDELITGVTEFIQNYCGGRNFLSQNYVEIQDTKHGRHKLFLKQTPVTALSAVEYRAGTPSAPIWNTYNADSYLLYGAPGYIHFYGALPSVAQGMRITYTAGYLIDFANEFTVTHTLPADLTMAANEMIATILNTRKSGGITNESTEGQSITYDFKRAMSDNVKNTLANYKLYRLAR
jgi:hypothetical protein